MSHRMIDARIIRWVDADTVVLELDVWPTIKTRMASENRKIPRY